MSDSDAIKHRTPPLSIAISMQDLAGGGVERQTLTLAADLQAQGVAVTLLVTTGEEIPEKFFIIHATAAAKANDEILSRYGVSSPEYFENSK